MCLSCLFIKGIFDELVEADSASSTRAKPAKLASTNSGGLIQNLTRFEPLGEMVIFGTYLRAGRGSEPVWLQGPKTSPKVPIIYGATSGGPNPKLMMTLKKACLPP